MPKTDALRSDTNEGRIPLFLEYVFTFSQIFVLFVLISSTMISILAGNNIWRIVIQVSIITLISGILLWGVNKIVFSALLDTTLDNLRQEGDREAEEAAAAAAAAAEAAAAAAAEEEAEQNSDVFETELQL